MQKQRIPTPWRWLTTLSLALLVVATTFGQDMNVVHERMKKDIFFLASPECEGRGIDTKGIDIAADYIINQLKQAGLKPAGKDGGWFQPFNYGKAVAKAAQATSSLVLKGPIGQTIELKVDTDFKALPLSGSGKAESQIVFVGYGLTLPAGETDKGKAKDKSPSLVGFGQPGKKKGGGPAGAAEKNEPVTSAGYDDFKGIDVKGKIVVVLRRVPRWENTVNPFAGDKDKYASLEKKIAACVENKAAAILVVNDRSEIANGDKFIAQAPGSASVPVLQLRRGVLDMMMVSGKGLKLFEVEADIDRDLKPRSGPIPGWSATVSTAAATQSAGLVCKNIVATLEGAGPLANEIIVVGAHYDHLGYGLPGMGGAKAGKDGIGRFPGADDNGSGSTTIMEVARRFAAMKERQGRRLVFIWFSGEESGLLGSKAYVANPIFPLNKTVAMVNIDMVGRLKEGANPELYAEGFDTGKGLNDVLKELNKDFGFKIVGPHKQQIYGRSDQASFYNKGIPGVFFFTDFHDDYHKKGDLPEKINVAGMAKVAGLAEKLVAHLTTVAQPPEYVAGAIKGKGAPKQPAKAAAKLGLTPDNADKSGQGALVEAVAAGGAAAKAGIMPGDRITAINGTPIPTVTAYLSLLQQLKAGTVITVTLQRKGMELTLKVTTE